MRRREINPEIEDDHVEAFGLRLNEQTGEINQRARETIQLRDDDPRRLS